MSDQQFNLPASFGKAHDLSSHAAPDAGGPIFTGTITQLGKIQHFERGTFITIADVALNENYNALGFFSANKAHDYYLANGFQLSRKPAIDASPNPWKRLLRAFPLLTDHQYQTI